MTLSELLAEKKRLRMEICRLAQDEKAVSDYLDQLAEIERQLKAYGR